MGRSDDSPASLLQGTLDMLILKCAGRGPLHGYDIAEWIEQRSEEVLRVEEGGLYPALHRLEVRGMLSGAYRRTTGVPSTAGSRPRGARRSKPNLRTGSRCRVRSPASWMRIAALGRRRRLDQDLEDVIAFHLAMKAKSGNAGFAVVAAFAAWLPARRAARLDPVIALRYE